MHSGSRTPRFQTSGFDPGKKRLHAHRRTKSLTAIPLSPSNVNQRNGAADRIDFDLLVEKAKGKISVHDQDFDSLLHATEQLVIAQRLKDLGHKVMIETLQTLRCSPSIKKKSNELSELLYELYLKEIQRTESFTQLLDVLENVKQTHRETILVLQQEYEKAEKAFADFKIKHPELNFSPGNVSPQSSSSSDEESSLSTHSFSQSIFSFLRHNSHSDYLNNLETGENLKSDMSLRRNDFVNAVNILETKSSHLVVSVLNDICNLYREGTEDEEPEPLQPL